MRQEYEVVRLAEAGLRHLHWDVSDGIFAAPGGFRPENAELLGRIADLDGEAHLMVSDPLRHVDAWTTFCSIVAVHVEAEGWQRALNRVEKRGATPVLAVGPSTPLSMVHSWARGLLVMSVSPGRAGSAFQPATVNRLRTLKGDRLLGVDGGIDEAAARHCREAGASWIVSGTALIAATDLEMWLSPHD